MARGKPLTRFLIALCHSGELLARFNSGDREGLLREWGLEEHELFRSHDVTLEQVQAAVAAEHHEEAAAVGVAWWIWFFGGPRPRPDWIWGVDDDPDDDDDDYGDDEGKKKRKKDKKDRGEHPGAAGGGGDSNPD